MSGVASAEPVPTPDLVERGPEGTRFSEVRRFGRIDSTNRYLLDLARLRPAPGVVAVADHQTAGRGRLGRNWEAPEGANLLASMLLVPRLEVEQLHLCSVAVALAAAEACRTSADLEPSLKWPNDLLVGDRKLAGILAESTPLPAGGGWDEVADQPEERRAMASAPPEPRRTVVVGIGLNMNWPPPGDEAPEETAGPAGAAGSYEEIARIATSILRETGKAVDRRLLLDLLLVELENRLRQLDEPSGPVRLAAEYRRRCGTIGQAVRVVTADGEIRGDAIDVTPEGQLLVDAGARLFTISAGDVVHVHREA